MVADELPEAVTARVVERYQIGESAAEISAWLADLGYRVSPDEVQRLVSRHWQRGDADNTDFGGGDDQGIATP